ncbi:ki-ras-induced actin-interacting protein-IP3R-interacting domain olf186-M isoform X2 [Lasioglossum baleicum]
MRRRTGPVQQWVDSLPSPAKSNLPMASPCQDVPLEPVTASSMTPTEPKDIPYPVGIKSPAMTISAPIHVPNTPTVNTSGLHSSLPHKLVRDPSLQSDSSHCSSVESLLELRKADPEAILLGLGFGGCSGSPQENGSLSRIPKRFLQPSKLKGIAINDFVKHQQETSESIDSVSLGYRGLTGSPYVAPSEIVQKIMQRLREHESHEHDPYAMYNSYEQYSPFPQSGTLSVLSPDNRQFLERPRSKSPDMRNKRMIIGQKSFAFGHDGDLIEINPSDVKRTCEDNLNNDPNSTERSRISRNFENTNVDNDKGFEGMTIQEIDKIVLKKSSFDNSIEFCDDNIAESLETYTEHVNIQNANSEDDIDCKEDAAFLNTALLNYSDIRRASDGFCDTKQYVENSSMEHARRHSDSFVHAVENGSNETILSQRRKTLRRQARINDIDAINYCTSKTCISDTTEEKVINSQEKIDIGEHSKNTRVKSLQKIDESIKSKNRDESCGKHCNAMPRKIDDSTRCIDDSLDEESQQHNVSKHYVEKSQSLRQTCIDSGEGTTNCCCCRSGSTKYWKKMDKIIQENKNFEKIVKKNRREMAEIREMLSSVLSVRLEPGF